MFFFVMFYSFLHNFFFCFSYHSLVLSLSLFLSIFLFIHSVHSLCISLSLYLPNSHFITFLFFSLSHSPPLSLSIRRFLLLFHHFFSISSLLFQFFIVNFVSFNKVMSKICICIYSFPLFFNHF